MRVASKAELFYHRSQIFNLDYQYRIIRLFENIGFKHLEETYSWAWSKLSLTP